jgi:Ca-activated chloride channel family protein
MRFLLLFSMLCAALPVLAQEPPVETLHVSSQLVEISASVTDRNGIPQTGLTKDDFILKQDGKEQAIRYFSGGDALPLTFIVMIDTSGSQRTFLDDETRACDVFFETVLGRPQDHAALVEVNAKVTGRSDLTNDPNKLHLALTALHYDQAASVATHINDAVHSLSKSILSKVHGRKAIILISDGGDVGSRVSFPDAIAEAQRDDVPVYAISYSAWSGLDPVAPGGLSGGYAGFNRGVSDSDPGLKNLKEWASATGGNVYQVTPKTTLKRIFTDIAQLLRSQYEIGYTLPRDTKPKQFHKLELKTKDKALRVQARTGFYTNP